MYIAILHVPCMKSWFSFESRRGWIIYAVKMVVSSKVADEILNTSISFFSNLLSILHIGLFLKPQSNIAVKVEKVKTPSIIAPEYINASNMNPIIYYYIYALYFFTPKFYFTGVKMEFKYC